MTLPAFFDKMSALDLPFPETVVTSHATRSDAGLVVFFNFHQDVTLPPHAHGHQWGMVIEGEMALMINGTTRRYGPGDTYDIAPGVTHSAVVKAGTYVLDVFAEPDRYPMRNRQAESAVQMNSAP